MEWLDAAVYPGETTPKGMATMQTVGYYHAKEPKFIRIASDYDPADKETRTDHIIPRIHIVRFTLLSPDIPWKDVKKKLGLTTKGRR